LGDLDRLLLLWEWRSTPTPWLWMRRVAVSACVPPSSLTLHLFRTSP